MVLGINNFFDARNKNAKVADFQDLDHLDGVSVSAVSANLYDQKRDDLVLFYFRNGANHASLFTKSSVVSENIKWNKKVRSPKIHALLINTRNANALTGSDGYEALKILSLDLSEKLTLKQKQDEEYPKVIRSESILFACTGTIGEKFPLEKIKKIESEKFNVEIADEELKDVISNMYGFPLDEYEKFKNFLELEKIDIDVIKEQLSAELMWKKFTRQKFSSKITINKSEVDTLANNLMNKVGKVEYNYSEILFKNIKENDLENTKKRMNKVLSLLESELSFDLVAKKFDENISTTNLEKNRWVMVDNLDDDLKSVLNQLVKSAYLFSID